MIRYFGFFLVGLAMCSPANAEIPVVEIGRGDGVKMGRIAFQFDSGMRWFSGGQWHVAGYWEPAIGFWQGKSTQGDPQIFEFALTPILRLEKKSPDNWSPYLESGVGIHLITGHHVTDDRDLGSNYHFGSHIGVGLRFGKYSEFDIGYRLQHISNAGLKQPNEGINFYLLHLRLSY